MANRFWRIKLCVVSICLLIGIILFEMVGVESDTTKIGFTLVIGSHDVVDLVMQNKNSLLGIQWGTVWCDFVVWTLTIVKPSDRGELADNGNHVIIIFYIFLLALIEMAQTWATAKNSARLFSKIECQSNKWTNTTDVSTMITKVRINGIEVESITQPSIQKVLDTLGLGLGLKAAPIKRILGPEETIVWVLDYAPDTILPKVEILSEFI
jgi:hypothetical protein